MKSSVMSGVVVAATLLAAPAAVACDFWVGYDDKGYWHTPFLTNDANVAMSRLAFVGTVVGFRTLRGDIIAATCGEVCEGTNGDGVLSVVFNVEHGLAGIEGGLHEEAFVSTTCGPYFRTGARYLVTDNLYFGRPELDAMPTAEEIARWRSLVPPYKPRPGDVAVPETDCLTPPEEVLAELAPTIYGEGDRTYVATRLDFVARILSFRLDDTTLTDDASPCNDQASPECATFKQRIVSVVVETEAVVTGERAIGIAELRFRGFMGDGAACPLPLPGQRFLLGSERGLDADWPEFTSPRFLLTHPPDTTQLDQWRAAARVTP